MALGSRKLPSAGNASAADQQPLAAALPATGAALSARRGLPLRAVPFLRVFPLFCLLFAAVAIPALLVNSARASELLWAVGFWQYVPIPARIALVALFGAALCGVALVSSTRLGTGGRGGAGPGAPGPGTQRGTAGTEAQSGAPGPEARWRAVGGGVLPWLFLLLLGAVFWTFRERTYAGDALLKLIMLDEKGLYTDPYVWKEPLDALLVYSADALLRPWGISPAETMARLSVVAGMVYAGAIFWLARLLLAGRAARGLFVAGMLALGSSQLWFGHIESYSWVTACTMLTAVLALAARQRPGLLWAAGLAGGAAVSFHPQAAFALPALLLLLERRRWRRQVLVLAAAGAVVPLLTAGTLLRLGVPLPGPYEYSGDLQLFWTPAQALAPRQLWDGMVNLWLLVPALPLLGALTLWGWTQRAVRSDRSFRYLCGMAGGLLFYSFSFQNDLPRPQDWDLYAIAGPPVAAVGWYVGIGYWAAGRQQAVRQAVRQAVLLAGLLCALLYAGTSIGVNHAYTIVRPEPIHRALYARYRLGVLEEGLAGAFATPRTAICVDPAGDPTGCRRVTRTSFNIPPDGKDSRPVIFAHAPARIVFDLDLPPEPTFLWLNPALDPYAWEWGGDGVTFRVLVRCGHRHADERGRERRSPDLVLYERHLTPQNPEDRGWQEAFVSLAAYAGQRVQVILETAPGPQGNPDGDRAGWGIGWWMRGTVQVAEVSW